MPIIKIIKYVNCSILAILLLFNITSVTQGSEVEMPVENITSESKVDENSDSNQEYTEEISSESNESEESSSSIEGSSEGSSEEERVLESSEVLQEESKNEVSQQDLISPMALLDVKLFGTTDLTAGSTLNNENKSVITLVYTASSVLNVELGNNQYIVFQLPNEIMNKISSNGTKLNEDMLEIHYSLPRVLGILPPDEGQISSSNIYFTGNKLYARQELSGIKLLADYEYTLVLTLDKLPATESGEYQFFAELVDGQADLISLNLANDGVFASNDTLPAPKIPNAPIIEPIYDNSTTITGTALPGSQIQLMVGRNLYETAVNEDGSYAVTIPQQPVGTEITAKIMDTNGNESPITIIIVADGTPPEPPIVDEIYDYNDVIRGSGEVGSTAMVTINGVDYESEVGIGGRFNIPLEDDQLKTVTNVSVKLVDESGNPSGPTLVTVQQGGLSFETVPSELKFETTKAGSGDQVIKRAESNEKLKIVDTREPGNDYSIYAKAGSPLTSTNNHILLSGLVYIDENSNITPLDGEDAIKVYSGETIKGSDRTTEIVWPEDEGPLINVNTDLVFADSYSTSITWTLSNAP